MSIYRGQNGHWGMATGAGCAPCGCDSTGAVNASCHQETGQCHCQPGVGGTRCDVCLPGYYGFSEKGCQRKYQETKISKIQKKVFYKNIASSMSNLEK